MIEEYHVTERTIMCSITPDLFIIRTGEFKNNIQFSNTMTSFMDEETFLAHFSEGILHPDAHKRFRELKNLRNSRRYKRSLGFVRIKLHRCGLRFEFCSFFIAIAKK